MECLLLLMSISLATSTIKREYYWYYMLWIKMFINVIKILNYHLTSFRNMDILEWIPNALVHEIKDLEKNDPISYRQIHLGDLDYQI